jgi:hypothetical protein
MGWTTGGYTYNEIAASKLGDGDLSEYTTIFRLMQ